MTQTITTSTSTSTSARGTYGELRLAVGDPANAILQTAFTQRLLAAPHCSIERDQRGRLSGAALNYDIYDVDRARRRMIIQQRKTIGDKYGLHPIKTYLLITWFRGKVRAIEPAPKAYLIRKLTSVATREGDIIRTILGEAAKPLKLPSPVAMSEAYKALAVADGGFYYYKTPEEALDASVPESSVYLSAPRVVAKVVVAGKRIRYGSKFAATQMTILEIVSPENQ